MKTIVVIFISFIFSLKLSAQSTVTTATLLVKGNCGECKERIENAADIKGVKVCKWNEDTKIATITYDSKKVTFEQIEKAIAKSGHETGKVEADSSAYKNLPNCCKYKDGKCEQK